MNFDNKRTIPRYLFIIIVLTLVGTAIVGKAIYEMLVRDSYWETVRKRMASQQKDIPAIRGNIYSADGQLMVGSMPVYTLRADFVVKDPNDPVAEEKLRVWRDSTFKADLDSLCLGLHELFPDLSAADFRAKLLDGKSRGRRNLAIRHNVSYIKYKEFLKLPYVHHGRIKTGFYAEEIPQRQKPYGSMANRTLGSLMTSNDSARNGLELAYDTVLAGTPGIKHRRKVLNKFINISDTAAVDGEDIVTTIDVSIQDLADQSDKSTKEIQIVIENIVRKSEHNVTLAGLIKEAVDNEGTVLEEVSTSFEDVDSKINETAHAVENIKIKAEELDKNKDVVFLVSLELSRNVQSENTQNLG